MRFPWSPDTLHFANPTRVDGGVVVVDHEFLLDFDGGESGDVECGEESVEAPAGA